MGERTAWRRFAHRTITMVPVRARRVSVVNGRSHYDELGVAPNASSEVIRDSYRRLAREFHPDRMRGSAAGGDRMPDINEAYRVLSDPGRRAVYDAQHRPANVAGSGAPPPSSAASDTFGGPDVPAYRYRHPDGPARVPWRSLLFFSAIAIVIILVLAQFSKPADPAAPDGILRGGDCVEILANGDAKELACTGSGDLVVRQFIAFDRVCSNGWEPHRDRQGMGIACIEREPEVPTT